MSWDWSQFQGSPECLQWSRRDLANLEAAMSVVRGRSVAVQAGGNVGIFPRRLSELFETVYTFEPSAELFPALVANAPASNVIKLQAALGTERGGVRVEASRRDGSDKPIHAGLTHVAGVGSVPTLLVDDLALEVCDLIYLDVEGWELFALIGAAETIRRCRPVIGVEINKQLSYSGATEAQLRTYIEGHHYRRAMKVNSDEIFVPT